MGKIMGREILSLVLEIMAEGERRGYDTVDYLHQKKEGHIAQGI